MKKKTVLFSIFLILFLDLCGFGMIIPLIPYLSQKFGADSLLVGLLLSSYSLMQFLFNPFWGALSDRIGRRPVILLSLLGASLSDLIFAFGTELEILFLARILSGFFGANIATAFSYVSDITEKENRSKAMGLIGASLGLGFMIGPFLGAMGGKLGVLIGDLPPFGEHFAVFLSGILRFLNFILAFFILKESFKKEKRQKIKLSFFLKVFSQKNISSLMSSIFNYSLCMTLMEVCLFLLLYNQFKLTHIEASFAFCYVGLMIAFTQGILIRVVRSFAKEKLLVFAGGILMCLGFSGISFSYSIPILAFFITLICLGSGFFQPSLNALLSFSVSRQEQGSIFGISQSLSSLGRVIGPSLGGFIYLKLQAQSFMLSSLIIFLSLIILFFFYKEKR